MTEPWLLVLTVVVSFVLGDLAATLVNRLTAKRKEEDSAREQERILHIANNRFCGPYRSGADVDKITRLYSLESFREDLDRLDREVYDQGIRIKHWERVMAKNFPPSWMKDDEAQ